MNEQSDKHSTGTLLAGLRKRFEEISKYADVEQHNPAYEVRAVAVGQAALGIEEIDKFTATVPECGTLEQAATICEKVASRLRSFGDRSSELQAQGATECVSIIRQLQASAPVSTSGELQTYRAALDKIISDDNCDPVQIAHEAITPHTPWRKATKEETAAIDAMVLANDFGDPHTLLNSREWLTKAVEAKGAKVTGGGCGGGQADIDIKLEGCDFNVSIKPILRGVVSATGKLP